MHGHVHMCAFVHEHMCVSVHVSVHVCMHVRACKHVCRCAVGKGRSCDVGVCDRPAGIRLPLVRVLRRNGCWHARGPGHKCAYRARPCPAPTHPARHATARHGRQHGTYHALGRGVTGVIVIAAYGVGGNVKTGGTVMRMHRGTGARVGTISVYTRVRTCAHPCTLVRSHAGVRMPLCLCVCMGRAGVRTTWMLQGGGRCGPVHCRLLRGLDAPRHSALSTVAPDASRHVSDRTYRNSRDMDTEYQAEWGSQGFQGLVTR